MFYVIIDKFPRIVVERWKEITTNLKELSCQWIILWEDESPCFFEISSICFHSVLNIHDYLRDTIINDENTIVYLRTNEKYASVWFHMLEQMNIEWFFTNFPNMLDEIHKIEIMKNYKILYIPFAPIEKSNHFTIALFNLIHSGFINRKVQPEQQELFRSLQAITPRQGLLYWYEPQFSLVEVLNLISLHKNITLEGLTDYLLSKECQLQSHTNTILNQSIHLLKNYNQDFSYSLDYQQHESPSFFVWKAGVLNQFLANRSSTSNGNVLHELMNNPECNIGLVDLSKWKNVQIKWFQSRGIPAQTIDYLSKIESFFKPSRSLNNSIYHDYHQFIWFPFQEEYQHVFNTNINEYIQSTNQILRNRYLIQNYFIESKCQMSFVYLLRSTNMADFIYSKCWNEELGMTLPIINTPDSTLKKYIDVIEQTNVLFGFVWVWDIFTMPMMYQETLDNVAFDEWTEYIQMVLNFILSRKNYIHNEDKQPLLWVALPVEGRELYRRFMEKASASYINKCKVIFLNDYPIRTEKYSFIKTSTVSYMDYDSISYVKDFHEIPSNRFQMKSLSRDCYWRHSNRFDNFDLSSWNQWYDVLFHTVQKITKQRPIFVSTWERKLIGAHIWCHWHVSTKVLNNPNYRQQLSTIAGRLQESQLMGVALIASSKEEMKSCRRQEGWKHQWWYVIDGLEQPSNFLGWVINCSIFYKIDRDLTWREGFEILANESLKHQSILPQWIPIENLVE